MIMTYSILLTVKKPEKTKNYKDDDRYEKEYDALRNFLQEMSLQNKGIRFLAETTLLLPLDYGLHDLADVVKMIRSLPYTYAVLTEDTKCYNAANPNY
jgi:hypothetical protein